MTIPNLITSIRIILTPIFVIYLINDRPLEALVVFILAGLSKITTCLQLGTVFAVLSKEYFHLFSQINEYVFLVTGLLTISSGLHYMRYWFRVMGEESQSQ